MVKFYLNPNLRLFRRAGIVIVVANGSCLFNLGLNLNQVEGGADIG